MADKTEKKFNPKETTWYRGWTGNSSWMRSRWYVWVLAVLLAGGGVAAYEIKYAGLAPATAAVYGVIAAAIGFVLFFLISLWWHLGSGVGQQRDEARQEFTKTSAQLQEKTRLLNSCTNQLVDLEVKHKALTETYQPIKELASFKSGDVVKGKKFNVSLLFNQMNTSVVSKITFENCTFAGPAVLMLIGNETETTGTSFGGTLDNVVVKAEPGKGYLGMCVFLNCKIRNCVFQNIGILADDAMKEKLKNQTKNP